VWLSRELETAAFFEPVVALRDFSKGIEEGNVFDDEEKEQNLYI
jgi:hypothetical protein